MISSHSWRAISPLPSPAWSGELGKQSMSNHFVQASVKKPPIHPLLKLGLDLGPLVLFFVANSRWGIFAATAAFMAAAIVAFAVSYWLTRRVPLMALMSTLVVVVFGGLWAGLRPASRCSPSCSERCSISRRRAGAGSPCAGRCSSSRSRSPTRSSGARNPPMSGWALQYPLLTRYEANPQASSPGGDD